MPISVSGSNQVFCAPSIRTWSFATTAIEPATAPKLPIASTSSPDSSSSRALARNVRTDVEPLSPPVALVMVENPTGPSKKTEASLVGVFTMARSLITVVSLPENDRAPEMILTSSPLAIDSPRASARGERRSRPVSVSASRSSASSLNSSESWLRMASCSLVTIAQRYLIATSGELTPVRRLCREG